MIMHRTIIHEKIPLLVAFELEVDGFVVETIYDIENSKDSIEVVPLIINRTGSQTNIIDTLSKKFEDEVSDTILNMLQGELNASQSD